MNLPLKQKKITDIEVSSVVAKGKGVGGGKERELGVSRCQLVSVECINNNVLLHSTEDYV